MAHHPPDTAGLYIHVPFCIRKCPYCDFYSIGDLSLISAFIVALKREIKAVETGGLMFDTIYIGGGTPTVLTPEQISEILQQIFRLFSIAANAEITIEANPGTVNFDRLKSYYRAGIRRINIGVQSFTPEILSFLGRIHTVEEALQAVHDARRAGFENLGIDLIYGIPGQNNALWRRDLETAVALSPEHLSCYMLSYEHGTPMSQALREKKFEPLPDEATAALFETTHSYLDDAGYEHYEISNFARMADRLHPSYRHSWRSRHNIKYWNFAPYTGLGPSSHSFTGQIRSWNHADVKRYIALLNEGKLPIQAKEVLTSKQMMMEALYLGLRTAEGIDITRFEKKFDVGFAFLFAAVLEDMKSQGLLTFRMDRCALTTKGMLFLDSIAAKLIDEIEDTGEEAST